MDMIKTLNTLIITSSVFITMNVISVIVLSTSTPLDYDLQEEYTFEEFILLAILLASLTLLYPIYMIISSACYRYYKSVTWRYISIAMNVGLIIYAPVSNIYLMIIFFRYVLTGNMVYITMTIYFVLFFSILIINTSLYTKFICSVQNNYDAI